MGIISSSSWRCCKIDVRGWVIGVSGFQQVGCPAMNLFFSNSIHSFSYLMKHGEKWKGAEFFTVLLFMPTANPDSLFFHVPYDIWNRKTTPPLSDSVSLLFFRYSSKHLATDVPLICFPKERNNWHPWMSHAHPVELESSLRFSNNFYPFVTNLRTSITIIVAKLNVHLYRFCF